MSTCAPLFLTTLRTEKLENRWRRLTQPLVYHTCCLGHKTYRLTVPYGFVCDFASVPRIPVIFAAAGDAGHYAATLHDWMCRQGWEWGIAARIFREALLAEPYPEPLWRANFMYAGVLARRLLPIPYCAMPGVLDPRKPEETT